jgi:hypothetical protein
MVINIEKKNKKSQNTPIPDDILYYTHRHYTHRRSSRVRYIRAGHCS